MVKVDVVEDQWRRGRIREGRCFVSKKQLIWEFNFFSATKQNRVGPSLQSRICCLHLQIAVPTVQQNWICRLGRYLMPLSLYPNIPISLCPSVPVSLYPCIHVYSIPVYIPLSLYTVVHYPYILLSPYPSIHLSFDLSTLVSLYPFILCSSYPKSCYSLQVLGISIMLSCCSRCPDAAPHSQPGWTLGLFTLDKY